MGSLVMRSETSYDAYFGSEATPTGGDRFVGALRGLLELRVVRALMERASEMSSAGRRIGTRDVSLAMPIRASRLHAYSLEACAFPQ